MTQDIPPDARDRAYVLFGDLIEGRWEKAHRELDASLRGQVRLDRWSARAWAKAAYPRGRWTAPEWMICAQPPRLVVPAASRTESAGGARSDLARSPRLAQR
jgi:hypothetical protein